jgi:hypothetical protein
METAADLFSRAGFTGLTIYRDLADRPRVIGGTAPGEQ